MLFRLEHFQRQRDVLAEPILALAKTISIVLLCMMFSSEAKASLQAEAGGQSEDLSSFELSLPDLEWIYQLNELQKKYVQEYQAEAQAIIESTRGEEQSPSRTRSCTKCSAKGQETKRSLAEDHYPQGRYPRDRYPRLLIFVSFSMPIPTLKSLAQQAALVRGKLVFRGLVDNSFKRTAQKLEELGTEALIDPTLFRAYSIKIVPVFVLQERSPSFPGEEGIQHDRVTGNVTLHFALSKMVQQGETADPSSLLDTLENING